MLLPSCLTGAMLAAKVLDEGVKAPNGINSTKFLLRRLLGGTGQKPRV
jgi:hypothetical protein